MSGLGQAMWRQAESDIAHARAALDLGHFDWATFAAQQAAEKALKAVLLLAGRTAPPVHDLLGLFERLVEHGLAPREELERLRPDLLLLFQGWLVSRYPIGGSELAPNELIASGQAESAIASSARVLAFASSLGAAGGGR